MPKHFEKPEGEKPELTPEEIVEALAKGDFSSLKFEDPSETRQREDRVTREVTKDLLTNRKEIEKNLAKFRKPHDEAPRDLKKEDQEVSEVMKHLEEKVERIKKSPHFDEESQKAIFADYDALIEKTIRNEEAYCAIHPESKPAQ